MGAEFFITRKSEHKFWYGSCLCCYFCESINIIDQSWQDKQLVFHNILTLQFDLSDLENEKG